VGCVNDWVPAALGRLDLDSLIGLSVAEARARVEEAAAYCERYRVGGQWVCPTTPDWSPC